MSGEEEDKEYELKDLIVQTLETTGLLSKIKAQIRANVFKALDEADRNDPKNDAIQNIASKRALNAPEGRTAASLVREYLESANLDYTISVFDPELNSAVGLEKRDKLANSLRLKETDTTRDLPLLIELLKNYSNGPREPRKDTFSQDVVDSIKSKFDSLDNGKKGTLPLAKASKLMSDIFPNFSSGVFEVYLDENDLSKNGIEFKQFLNHVKKWHKSCESTSQETGDHVLSDSKPTNDNKKNLISFGNDDNDDDLMKLGSNFLKENVNKSNNENKKPSSMSSLGDLPPINALNTNKKPLTIRDLGKSKDDDDYEDDFTNGTTPRTPSMDRKGFKNRGGLISDEEMDDNLSYIEESSKLDEVTNDRSISTIHGNNDADYIEDVSI